MRIIGALIYPGFELLDLCGPMEMFGQLPQDFEIITVAESRGPVKSGQSLSVLADLATSEAQHYDILFVPGGPGTRREVNNDHLLNWIESIAAETEFVMSVCTGSALLARAGVLDGLRATSNKAVFKWVTGLGPNVHWEPVARWVEDGRVFTSSGVSAGMDMTLAALSRMHGQHKAEEVAMLSEYTWHRDPEVDPFAAIHGLA